MMKMKSNNRHNKNQEKENRGVGEARARNFILKKAAALMERSLKDRGFIAEKGFKKVVSPFVEMLENRG